MTLSIVPKKLINIRSLQYKDLEAIKALASRYVDQNISQRLAIIDRDIMDVASWYGLRKFLNILPYTLKENRRIFVAEVEQQILGLIQVSPFNSTGSTWKVERLIIVDNLPQLEISLLRKEIGSQLLRYCLENIWEARTWILEADIHDKNHLSIYRESGFQPLAQLTYWQLAWEIIEKLSQENSDLPNNLSPISNADASLLYQLDCVSLPPLLRQIFDRHVRDFKSTIVEKTFSRIRQWIDKTEVVQGYIFEPQRKAAIGYFQLESRYGESCSHQAKLTVNPAYTWLYPELLVQMAQIAHKHSLKINNGAKPSLELISADYQPEREEFLNELGASPTENTLLMSRSVWHKIRESKPLSLDGLQLSGVLKGLQPSRTPIPSRISWLQLIAERYNSPSKYDFFRSQSIELNSNSENDPEEGSQSRGKGHHA